MYIDINVSNSECNQTDIRQTYKQTQFQLTSPPLLFQNYTQEGAAERSKSGMLEDRPYSCQSS